MSKKHLEIIKKDILEKIYMYMKGMGSQVGELLTAAQYLETHTMEEYLNDEANIGSETDIIQVVLDIDSFQATNLDKISGLIEAAHLLNTPKPE